MKKNETTRLYDHGYGCEYPDVFHIGDRCKALCHRNMGQTDCGGRSKLSKPLREVEVTLKPVEDIVEIEDTKLQTKDPFGDAYLAMLGY